MNPKRNEYLASVFEDTMNIIKEKEFTIDPEFSLKYDVPIDMEDTSYDKKGDVEIVDSDTFDSAKSIIESGMDESEVCVLNMGSIWKYGGGVEKGSRAQEECLCRRSTLYPLLKAYAERYKKAYPNGGEHDVIYTSNVTVLKDASYKELPHPYNVNVITAAALQKPTLVDGHLSEKDAKFLEHKIHQMINVAAFNGNGALVLGAFGCGAYGCPSRDMAKIFHHALVGENLRCLFDVVKFAIIDDHNAFREDNKEGNLSVFKEVFKG